MILFSHFFGKKDRATAADIYQWALAQAQQNCPERFKEASKNKDDRRVRFEAISMFMTVAYYALLNEGKPKLARYAMEEMFNNFEVALREQGVSDVKVGKEMRILAGAFNGRLTSYKEGLETLDKKSLAVEIEKNKAAEKAEATPLSAAMIAGMSDIKGIMPKNNA